MDTIVVYIAIALAVVYLVQRLYRILRRPSAAACGCGCQGCADQHRCAGVDPPLR